MIEVYGSSLEKKMKLAFNMFDFDSNGKINSEDVRILLSYIPFRHEKSLNITTLN